MNEGQLTAILLSPGTVVEGLGILAKAEVLAGRHDADHQPVLATAADLFADGVVVRPKAIGERLIDDRDTRRIAVVVRCEGAAAHDGYAHGGEVTVVDLGIVETRPVPSFRNLVSLGQHTGLVVHQRQRCRARVAHRLDAGLRQQIRTQRIKEGVELVYRVTLQGWIDARVDQSIGVEAEIHAPHLLQATQNHPGGNQQHQAQCHLSDDERVTQARRASPRARCAVLQRPYEILASGADGRRQPEYHAGDRGHHERERQHGDIHPDIDS